jgi:hypothetical protein
VHSWQLSGHHELFELTVTDVGAGSPELGFTLYSYYSNAALLSILTQKHAVNNVEHGVDELSVLQLQAMEPAAPDFSTLPMAALVCMMRHLPQKERHGSRCCHASVARPGVQQQLLGPLSTLKAVPAPTVSHCGSRSTADWPPTSICVH